MSNDRTPVFVYGTLRNGLGNYRNILDGNTDAEAPAILTGATMYDAGGFPFVSPGGLGEVIGELMWLTDDEDTDADYTMARLDRLEGYRGPGQSNMYDRMLVTVTLSDGESAGTRVDAWTYVTGKGSQSWLKEMPIIHGGDWKTHKAIKDRGREITRHTYA